MKRFSLKSKNGLMTVFGIGPFYGGFIILISAISIFCIQKGYLDQGHVSSELLENIFVIAGVLLTLAGIILWAVAIIGQRITHAVREGNLMTSGIYAWTRNPVYAGVLFACSGILLMASNWYLLILPPLFWLLLTYLLIHTEEKWLTQSFGEDYLKYKDSVNRVFPCRKK